MQGRTKNTPGPRGPPGLSLPSLKMTALSYSCTTRKLAHKLSGNVKMRRSTAAKIAIHSIIPICFDSSGNKKNIKEEYSLLFDSVFYVP